MAAGIIYSSIFVDLRPKSTNIDQWDNASYDWRDGLFEVVFLPLSESSDNMADNTPVEVTHWNATGSLSPSSMEHWKPCMQILTHI